LTLVAILVADVVGYSRLAEADEERTLARLAASQRYDQPRHRSEPWPHRQAHRRRKHVEFRSVIDPRIEVQNGMVELNFGLLLSRVPAAKDREARSGDLHVAVMTA
jgi:hypothetical protein